jgi:hypothetical protein
MNDALALTQTPPLLIAAMCRRGRARGERVPPASRQKPQNNYVAERRKPGAAIGNRNAVKPGLAELRALKAKLRAFFARSKAAIASVNRIVAARPKRRRTTIFIYEIDGVVRRVRVVKRIGARLAKAKAAAPVSAKSPAPPRRATGRRCGAAGRPIGDRGRWRGGRVSGLRPSGRSPPASGQARTRLRSGAG